MSKSSADRQAVRVAVERSVAQMKVESEKRKQNARSVSVAQQNRFLVMLLPATGIGQVTHAAQSSER